ncbi:nuclear prelamin A recognition factor [Erpetoichthys calabaricus]|uniref:Nuclear prelamin A recognition factor n=1 Tax=Erpetoichthys calabaricus TaxID=27687 RepID=A0A8C4TRF1_ERPCA|nr:nuclear prelamin A recognition factor [Erpetoichthys calabaricus]
MKCDNCTKTECNKKQKNDENQASASSEFAKGDENAEEKSEFHKLASERVFLSDCLACDKCVTDEESQHIYQQNERELFNILSLNKKCDTSKHKVLVASLCPQSLPYFAAKFKVGIAEAARKLCGFLKCLGIQYVFDGTLASDFSVIESQQEFVHRYRRHNQDPNALPMFTSACPGWIRYAERILGNLVTPHICTSKSPPQIMGSLVKDFFAKQQNLPPDKVYHLVVAPCFDKKLEALREEFYKSLLHTKDVDCVLTSGEIIQIMEKRNTSVDELDSVALDHIFGEEGELDIARHEGRGSEGFLEHIFKFSAKELFGLEVEEIVYRTLKNRDFQEVILEKDGEVLLQFAAVYGFRNIQNMIQKLKKGKFPYQLVEVLACSGGCLSGKGQAQSTNGKPDKALLQQMEEVYTSLPVRLPEKNATVQKLYQDWLEGIDSQKAQEALHTQYRAENLTSSTLDYKW